MNYADSCYNSDNFNKQKKSAQPAGLLNKIRHRGQVIPFSKTNESIATAALIKYDCKFINSDPKHFHWNQERLEPFTLVGWMNIFMLLTLIAKGIIFIMTPFLFVALVIAFFGDGGITLVMDVFSTYMYVLIPSFVIYFGPDKLLSDDKVLGYSKFFIRKNYTLNRQTGMVTVYGSGNKVIYEHPFLEFDCILQSNPNHQGILSYRLMLVHRYSDDKHVVDIGSEVGLHAPVADYHRFWNVIQRYMDISQPLPDIPMLEPFRDLDPITAEDDKKTGRNPRYWRSMTNEAYMATLKEIAEKQKKIPASGPEIDIYE